MSLRSSGLLLAVVVTAGFAVLATADVRTSRVPVAPARVVTAVAVLGLGLLAAVGGSWFALLEAALGAALVTGIQLLPYGLQRRTGAAWIGRADVRLAVPFGWTLGWFGLGFAVIGYLAALLAGLLYSAAARRRRIPFVPFLTLGLTIGLTWAAVVS